MRVDGPASRHNVLLLPDAADPADVYDKVCARLHESDLQTVVIEPGGDELTPAAVHAILDELNLPYANVAAQGSGAELAWQLCSGRFGRFSSLIIADHAHPAVPAADGTAADPTCAPLELPVTMLVTRDLDRAQADGSGRFVYGEFRVVPLDVANVAAEADNELATEIVLRTSLW
ncbi:alpha/beta hydrolase [Nocardia camponoti]|uniref:Alpha/beta hydrolase n=1 Tax=Nocardia camponoti TaxID=1616106 RepID=A0A917QC78_9NOCA|nr:alpha/beta hydrolase [Nocardia camponoti]